MSFFSASSRTYTATGVGRQPLPTGCLDLQSSLPDGQTCPELVRSAAAPAERETAAYSLGLRWDRLRRPSSLETPESLSEGGPTRLLLWPLVCGGAR